MCYWANLSDSVLGRRRLPDNRLAMCVPHLDADFVCCAFAVDLRIMNRIGTEDLDDPLPSGDFLRQQPVDEEDEDEEEDNDKSRDDENDDEDDDGYSVRPLA